MRSPVFALGFLMLLACDASGVEVVVQVKSDLVPGVEFTAVEVMLAKSQGNVVGESGTLEILSRLRTRSGAGATAEEAFVRGAAIGGFDDVDPGTYWVVARLVDASGAVVMERPTIIDVPDSTFGLTILFTRDCRGVECPSPGGGPELLACLAGECVDPRCHPRAPEFCPPPECTADGDCSGGSVCAPPRCGAEGICLLGARSDMCAAGEHCGPDVGCLPTPTVPDASVPDAGGVVCGTICFPPGRPCFAGYYDCTAETGPSCADLFQVAAGTSCGPAMECDAVGACVPGACTPGGRCWTECTEGTIDCAGGVRSCVLGAATVAPGTLCDFGQTCYDGEPCGGILACDATGLCTSPGPTRITGAGGVEADGTTSFPTLSADGSVVAFDSLATNLVTGDMNSQNDVFVYDLTSGMIERISVASDGTESNGYSTQGMLSADGRFVAFDSDATTLFAGDTTNRTKVFVHDRMTGTTDRISRTTTGGEPFLSSNVEDFTSDGRFVLFRSSSSEFAVGDTNTTWDGFVFDRMLSATERMTLDTGGVERADGGEPFWVSEDGNEVYFESRARLPDMSLGAYLYAYDRTTMTNTRLTETPAGAPLDRPAVNGFASRDGRFVGFTSNASNLLPGGNMQSHVYVLDRTTGVFTRISVSSADEVGNGSSDLIRCSDDGARYLFFSAASNLVPGDGGSQPDIFLRDLTTMTTVRVSEGPAMVEGDGISTYPTMSADGRRACFASNAANFAPGDTNGATDVFCVGVP